MTRRMRVLLSAAVHGVLAISTGCASYRANDLVVDRQASSMIQHHREEGLYVAAVCLADERSSRRHFGRHLVEQGYVPILVLLELDADSKQSFQIQKRELRLCLSDGRRLLPTDYEQVVDDVSFSHWRSFFGFVPWILPGFFVASSVNSANQDLEQDYEEKALRSVRVSPNLRAYHGVLFFRIPPEIRRDITLDDAFVEVSLFREGSGETGEHLGQRLEFPVHFSS